MMSDRCPSFTEGGTVLGQLDLDQLRPCRYRPTGVGLCQVQSNRAPGPAEREKVEPKGVEPSTS